MRGADIRQEGLFSYVSTESRVPRNHPLRTILALVDEGLAALSADFDAAYSEFGRPSIAPEKLIRAALLQVFYSIRSERLLMEQIDYNLLFRRCPPRRAKRGRVVPGRRSIRADGWNGEGGSMPKP